MWWLWSEENEWKEKIALATFVVAILMVAVVIASGYKPEAGKQNYTENCNMISLPNSKGLYYREETKIVYIIFNEVGAGSGYGYMAPYYSENGNLCKYENGKLIEIIKEENK